MGCKKISLNLLKSQLNVYLSWYLVDMSSLLLYSIGYYRFTELFKIRKGKSTSYINKFEPINLILLTFLGEKFEVNSCCETEY